MAMAMKTDWKTSAMSAKMPPLETLTPGGSCSAAIFSSTRLPMACASSPMMAPVMLADRTPSVRLMETGPSRITSSASSPRGAEPVGPATMREPIALSPPAVRGSPESATLSDSPSIIMVVTVWPMRYWAELEADLAGGEADAGGLVRVHLYRNLGGACATVFSRLTMPSISPREAVSSRETKAMSA